MGALDGLAPEFLSRLQAMAAAARAEGTSIGWGSGQRSIEEQARLRIKNGCPDVWTSPASSCRIPTAIPGRSNHNHGLAMDITGDKAWANANAHRFGLHFPVAGEDWHVEMIDDDGSRGHYDGASQMGAIGFDVNWQEQGQSPEEAQDGLIQSYLDAVTGAQRDALAMVATPDASVAATPVPTEVATPSMDGAQAPEVSTAPVRQDVTTVGGQAGAGGQWDGNVPPPGYVPPGEGVERWRAVAIAALKYTGQDPGLVDILLRRMHQESGGNPTIVNRWDSNAAKGDPTTGLMQNIPSAFNERARELAGRGITDGFANIVASIRYALKRYGSLPAAYNRSGGY